MFKRILLFMFMNIAVIAVLTIVFAILENVFGLSFDLRWFNYTSIFIYSLVVWFTGSFISLAISKWMAKRAYNINLITIKELSSFSEKERLVYNVVEELASRHHIKMPEVWIYEDNEPNAFATGATKNSALVAVSTGLLNQMKKDEIEGVIGHEMAHILNWDMVTMTLLQWVLNTFVVFLSRIIANIISNFMDEDMWALTYMLINIVLQILLGILASLIAMKFSRYREFRADEGSARFVWKEKMIAWLKALKDLQNLASTDQWSLATMKISTWKTSWFMSLFSSHPDLDDRIKNLKELKI